MRGRMLDGADEDRVITALVSGDDSALEVRGCPTEQRRPMRAALYLQVVESVGIGVRESPRVRFLILRENAHADPFRAHECRVDRRNVVDAYENEGWRQADGCEGADRHATIAPSRVTRAEYGHGRRKPSQHAAKEIGIDQRGPGKDVDARSLSQRTPKAERT